MRRRLRYSPRAQVKLKKRKLCCSPLMRIPHRDPFFKGLFSYPLVPPYPHRGRMSFRLPSTGERGRSRVPRSARRTRQRARFPMGPQPLLVAPRPARAWARRHRTDGEASGRAGLMRTRAQAATVRGGAVCGGCGRTGRGGRAGRTAAPSIERPPSPAARGTARRVLQDADGAARRHGADAGRSGCCVLCAMWGGRLGWWAQRAAALWGSGGCEAQAVATRKPAPPLQPSCPRPRPLQPSCPRPRAPPALRLDSTRARIRPPLPHPPR